MDWELLNSVCQGCVKDVIGFALPNVFQPFFPSVQSLQEPQDFNIRSETSVIGFADKQRAQWENSAGSIDDRNLSCRTTVISDNLQICLPRATVYSLPKECQRIITQ